MVIITFYRGHDDLLGEQKLKAGRSSQLHSHKHTWLMTKMRCQIQMISSQWVNQLVQCFHPDQLSEWFLDGLSFSFVQTIKVPRGWSLVTLRISWLLFWRHCEVDICFFNMGLIAIYRHWWLSDDASYLLVTPWLFLWRYSDVDIYICKCQVLATAVEWTAVKCSNHIYIPPRLDCSNFGDPVTKTPTGLI